MDQLINLKSSTKLNSLSKFLVLLVFVSHFGLNTAATERVYHLNQTDLDQISILDSKVIICKAADDKKWFNLWAKSYLSVDDINSIQKVYVGRDLDEVKKEMSRWLTVNYLVFLTNSSTINLKLYSDFCVGLVSNRPLTVKYVNTSFDLTNFFLFVFGVCLFYSSNYLSKKVYVYYASNITVGVIGSLLILVFLIYKFSPRRQSVYFALTSLWLNSWILYHIKQYLFTYPVGFYLLAYVSVAAIISFVFSYYRAPVKNHRLYDLFKWGLQSCALLIIYFSSEFFELILLIMVLILLKYNSPSIFKFKNDVVRYYRYYFPKQRKLMTKEEYENEGHTETEKALEELRNYCLSPQFNKWKALKKMKNASRFASFIDGEEHVSSDEIFGHISHFGISGDNFSDSDEPQLTDDDSDIE